MPDILDDADKEDSLITWIDPGYVDEYLNFYESWVEQNLLDSSHRYIDDFITLVKKLKLKMKGITSR